MPDVAQLIQYGASPRASLGIVRAARALALLRGRDYALPQDVQDIAPDVLRHRLVLSYDALADDIPADQIVDRIMQTVPLPTVAPRQSADPAADRLPPRPAARRRRCRRGRGRWPRLGLSRRRSRGRSRPRPAAARRAGRRRRWPGCSCSSPASSTGCCRATTWACCPARAARRASRGSTGPATTCAGWTGRSPPAPRVPHVRQTVADRELETWLAVDLSASLDFGTAALAQARPGDRRRGRGRPPDRARRQPDRRGGRHRRRLRPVRSHRLPGAAPGRKEAQGLLRARSPRTAVRSRAAPTSAR